MTFPPPKPIMPAFRPPFGTLGARMTQDQLKQAVAQAAVDFILPKLDDKSIVGVGTGSTANCFIDALARHKGAFDGAVAAPEATAARLEGHGIPVYELNTVSDLEFYVDGADEKAPEPDQGRPP